MKEVCSPAYVPDSPALLNFELIAQVQTICQEGVSKDPENIGFLQMS